MSELQITALTERHWPGVREIYAQGIATRNATFETVVPEWVEWDANHLSVCRFVAVAGDKVLGWAALSAVSRRWVYRGVAEVSVYIAEDARRQGVGSALLRALLADSERNGIWTLQATIHASNAVSIHLHASPAWTASGATPCCWNAEVRWQASDGVPDRSSAQKSPVR
jgi:L-amino acid N-acyltransferase YncA